MRRILVAGNWKMNLTYQEAGDLASDISGSNDSNVEVLVFPSSPFLSLANEFCDETISVGAQNCSQYINGAFTGEVSCSMLKSMDIDWVLIGHSERRQIFHEDNQIIAQKVNTAIAQGLNVIFCCGEMLEIRDQGLQIEFVMEQIKQGLFQIPAESFKQIVIAYEPIWAIGTGATASPEQAQEMHREIREFINKNINAEVADQIRILYGGSVNASNADNLFSMQDIDGALVGGASLKADSFNNIIQAALKL